MPKLSMIRLYKDNEVPDAILHEVHVLLDKISKCVGEAVAGHDNNIIMSALNRYHAAMVVHMVVESDIEKAAGVEAIGLIRNIEHLSGKKILPEGEKKD